MSMAIEVAFWLIATIIMFCVLNIYVGLRTAASLVLAFIITSMVVLISFKGIFADITLGFAIAVSMLYAIARAMRDMRDDSLSKKNLSSSDIRDDSLSRRDVDPSNMRDDNIAKKN